MKKDKKEQKIKDKLILMYFGWQMRENKEENNIEFLRLLNQLTLKK